MLLAGDGRGLQSLSQHASQLTHVCVDMLTVSGQPARITADLDPDVLSAAHAAKVHIFAILSNYAGQRWDTDAVEGLIQADAAVQGAFGDKLVEALQSMGHPECSSTGRGSIPSSRASWSSSSDSLHPRLHKDNLELWLSIPVGEDLRAFDLEDLPDVVDHLVAQLHDENGER